jgi:hypothetical protein
LLEQKPWTTDSILSIPGGFKNINLKSNLLSITKVKRENLGKLMYEILKVDGARPEVIDNIGKSFLAMSY